MDRIIENTGKHTRVLDILTNKCMSVGEQFLVTDLGRTVFSEGLLDG